MKNNTPLYAQLDLLPWDKLFEDSLTNSGDRFKQAYDALKGETHGKN